MERQAISLSTAPPWDKRIAGTDHGFRRLRQSEQEARRGRQGEPERWRGARGAEEGASFLVGEVIVRTGENGRIQFTSTKARVRHFLLVPDAAWQMREKQLEKVQTIRHPALNYQPSSCTLFQGRIELNEHEP
jgi:hypothetical protein